MASKTVGEEKGAETGDPALDFLYRLWPSTPSTVARSPQQQFPRYVGDGFGDEEAYVPSLTN